MRVRRRDLWRKFFGDRGPHLAAMIAYFALLAFVPLTFLSLSLLGLTGRADESSFLVKEIKHTLPGTPIDRIIDLVHTVQDNATALGIFVFLVSCYFVLTNDDLTQREVLPGAILAAILLEATFQVLPFYQRYADLNPALRAFGAPAILLVWLYVMSNVIVFGAELNWWRSRRADQRLVEELPGLA